MTCWSLSTISGKAVRQSSSPLTVTRSLEGGSDVVEYPYTYISSYVSPLSYDRRSGKVSTIALWGRSMGAATALMHGERDPSIAAMVIMFAILSKSDSRAYSPPLVMALMGSVCFHPSLHRFLTLHLQILYSWLMKWLRR